MNLVTLAIRNLRRRMVRSTIVALSVGLAVASALSLVALSDSIQKSTHESVDERGADLTVSQREAPDIFSGAIPEALERQLSTIPGVADVAGEMLGFATVEDRPRLVFGWSADSYFWQRMPILDGRLPEKGEGKVAVLGANVAQTLHKKVGDTIDIVDEQFRVVAIAGYASALNRSVIIIPLRDLQEILFKDAQVTMFHLKLAESMGQKDIDRISTAVASLGRYDAAPTGGLLAHDRNVTVLRAISSSVSLIALTLGALSVLSALLMAVQERTRELGVMMAIGWNRPRTMASVVIEGVVIGVAGSVIGVVLGYATSFSFTRLPQIGAYLDFKPTPSLILPTVLSAIALCAVGSLYPAWRAVSIAPADAIRST
jgi:putative ABC transport system permease protein